MPLQQPSHEDLKALLKKYSLKRQHAADLLHVTIHAVDSWCAPTTSTKARPIPLGMWELLLMKLGEIKY
jgi:hypothetical protein